LNAESDRVTPPASDTEKSGAGNGSYIHVSTDASAGPMPPGVGTVDGAAAANASRSIVPPSTMRSRPSAGTSVNTCVSPDGQCTVIEATRPAAPSPKISSRDPGERNPEPACTVFVLRPARSVSTVTRAPTASRLLFVPISRTASDEPARAKSLRKMRRCGAWRAAISTRSGSPSRSRSAAANARPS
jgi:hypothetical protein